MTNFADSLATEKNRPYFANDFTVKTSFISVSKDSRLDLPQVGLMNFRVEYVRLKSRVEYVRLRRGRCFHLRFTPKMRSGVTFNWYLMLQLEVLELNDGEYRFHSDQNNRTCGRFSCVESANLFTLY